MMSVISLLEIERNRGLRHLNSLVANQDNVLNHHRLSSLRIKEVGEFGSSMIKLPVYVGNADGLSLFKGKDSVDSSGLCFEVLAGGDLEIVNRNVNQPFRLHHQCWKTAIHNLH